VTVTSGEGEAVRVVPPRRFAALHRPALVAGAVVAELLALAAALLRRTCRALPLAIALLAALAVLALRQADVPIVHRPLGSLTIAELLPTDAQAVAIVPLVLGLAFILALLSVLFWPVAGLGGMLDDALRRREAPAVAPTTPETNTR
jgi:hypothetical protein